MNLPRVYGSRASTSSTLSNSSSRDLEHESPGRAAAPLPHPRLERPLERNVERGSRPRGHLDDQKLDDPTSRTPPHPRRAALDLEQPSRVSARTPLDTQTTRKQSRTLAPSRPRSSVRTQRRTSLDPPRPPPRRVPHQPDPRPHYLDKHSTTLDSTNTRPPSSTTTSNLEARPRAQPTTTSTTHDPRQGGVESLLTRCLSWWGGCCLERVRGGGRGVGILVQCNSCRLQ